MSGKQAKRRRHPSSPPEEQYEHDVAYFRARPRAEWRVRETAPGEWEPPEWGGPPVAPGTHVVVVYDRGNDVYHGLPLTPGVGIDPYDAAVVALVENPPRCRR